MSNDDVERCGAKTNAGGECKHPAGENGRCWIPSHTDPTAANPQGREFTLTEADHDDLLAAAREGKSERGCARAVGLSAVDNLRRYLDAHPDFRDRFVRARATGESLYIDDGRRPEGDTSFAKFMLSSSFDYKPTERVEEDVNQTTTHEIAEADRDAALEVIRDLHNS